MDDFHQPLLESINRKLALPHTDCKASFGTPELPNSDPVVDPAAPDAFNGGPITDLTLIEEPIKRSDKTEVVGMPIVKAQPQGPPPAPVSVPNSQTNGNESPYTIDKSTLNPLSGRTESCPCPSGSTCVGNSAKGQLIADEECGGCQTGQTWWPCDVPGLCWCWDANYERIAPAPASELDIEVGDPYYTVCDDILTREMFNKIAPQWRRPYTYEGLCDAILSYNAHHTEKVSFCSSSESLSPIGIWFGLLLTPSLVFSL